MYGASYQKTVSPLPQCGQLHNSEIQAEVEVKHSTIIWFLLISPMRQRHFERGKSAHLHTWVAPLLTFLFGNLPETDSYLCSHLERALPEFHRLLCSTGTFGAPTLGMHFIFFSSELHASVLQDGITLRYQLSKQQGLDILIN